MNAKVNCTLMFLYCITADQTSSREKVHHVQNRFCTKSPPAWPSTAACPACWAIVDTGIEICSELWGKIFCSGPTRAAKTEQKSLVLARQAQETNQERIPFICTLWDSFTSVSTVSRGHPSLVSLVTLLQPTRRAAVLDQPSSLQPHRSLSSLHCDVVLFLRILFLW
jgi:hypothetical protein